MMVDRKSVRPWMVVLAKALWEKKAKPHLESMSIPVRTKQCPFYNVCGPM